MQHAPATTPVKPSRNTPAFIIVFAAGLALAFFMYCFSAFASIKSGQPGKPVVMEQNLIFHTSPVYKAPAFRAPFEDDRKNVCMNTEKEVLLRLFQPVILVREKVTAAEVLA